jgi:protein-tyrosine phosphatase
MQSALDFLQLGIPDGGVAPDGAISRLAADCCARLRRGETLYVHCWGGHGRTGTLVSIMLGLLYGLSAQEAMEYTQACHDARVFPQGVRSPQTQVQVQQVRVARTRVGRWWGCPCRRGRRCQHPRMLSR